MKRMIANDYLIYTLEEGGDYEVVGDFNQKRFDLLRKNRYFEMKWGNSEPEKIYPAFATLVGELDNEDFLINEKGERV